MKISGGPSYVLSSPIHRCLAVCAAATLTAALFPATTQGNSQIRVEASTTIDPWAIERGLIDTLLVTDLAKEIAHSTAHADMADDADLLRQLHLYLRAGHRESALRLIRQIAQPARQTSRSTLMEIAELLITRDEWTLAQELLTRRPDAHRNTVFNLVRHLSETIDIEATDRWLAGQLRTGKDAWWRTNFFPDGIEFDPWLRSRVQLLSEEGIHGPLLDALETAAKTNPGDVDRTLTFVIALHMTPDRRSVDWIGHSIRPTLAWDGYELGRRLGPRSPGTAARLLEASLETPYSVADEARYQRHLAIYPTPYLPFRDGEEALRSWTRFALLQAYRQNGDAQEAQELLEAHPNAESYGQLAGAIQRASGARVIERRILDAEELREDDPRYWVERASYYIGRQEHEQTVAAFERALSLIELEGSERRKFTVSRYIHYLTAEADDRAAALRLLWTELEDAPPGSDYASFVVGALVRKDEHRLPVVSPDDERLWRYLSARRRWHDQEPALLRKMLDALLPESRPTFWRRLAHLAEGGDASRSLELGQLLLHSGDVGRAIPWLESGLGRTEDPQARTLAHSNLFRAYLESGAWRRAEELWLERPNRGPYTTEPIRAIAVAAAEAGDRNAAMRLWRRHANLDRSQLRPLSVLSALGLREELKSFYEEMAAGDPVSWVPTAALEILDGHALDE